MFLIIHFNGVGATKEEKNTHDTKLSNPVLRYTHPVFGKQKHMQKRGKNKRSKGMAPQIIPRFETAWCIHTELPGCRKKKNKQTNKTVEQETPIKENEKKPRVDQDGSEIDLGMPRVVRKLTPRAWRTAFSYDHTHTHTQSVCIVVASALTNRRQINEIM